MHCKLCYNAANKDIYTISFSIIIGLILPFVIQKLFAKERQKAFLFLIRELGYSQKEAQRLIAKGRLHINGQPMCNTAADIEGPFEFISFEPDTRNLSPVFVTDDFAVFDKPSGVLIHPQNRHTAYSLIDEIKYQFGHDANIVHRIDQETSGLVLAARNKQSERTLKMMFQERDVEKSYLALVHGHFKSSMDVSEPLLRQEDESAIVRMIVKVHPDGKPSHTSFVPLEYFPEFNMTLVRAKPFTGRQHQIRVHLFHVKHPIVGDPIYGQYPDDIVRFLDRELTPENRINLSGATRLLLHAESLNFNYLNQTYRIVSPVDFLEQAFKAFNP